MKNTLISSSGTPYLHCLNSGKAEDDQLIIKISIRFYLTQLMDLRIMVLIGSIKMTFF